MDIAKINKKIEKYGDERYSEGWDDGYNFGTENVVDLKEYRDMLSFRMSLAFDSAMKDNKMTNAKIYKEIIEYLELDLIDDPYNSIEVK
jgi:hypothetical protein